MEDCTAALPRVRRLNPPEHAARWQTGEVYAACGEATARSQRDAALGGVQDNRQTDDRGSTEMDNDKVEDGFSPT